MGKPTTFSGVESGVAPGARTPLVGESLIVFISRRLVSQAARGAADFAEKQKSFRSAHELL